MSACHKAVGADLTSRVDLEPATDVTETFGYDFLDRLIGTNGPYIDTFVYNQIGS